MTSTTAEWIACLGGKVPIAPVYNVRQALENPFVGDQRLVLDFQHAEHEIRGIASPVCFDGAKVLPTRAAPGLGRTPTPSWKSSATLEARARSCAGTPRTEGTCWMLHDIVQTIPRFRPRP